MVWGFFMSYSTGYNECNRNLNSCKGKLDTAREEVDIWKENYTFRDGLNERRLEQLESKTIGINEYVDKYFV